MNIDFIKTDQKITNFYVIKTYTEVNGHAKIVWMKGRYYWHNNEHSLPHKEDLISNDNLTKISFHESNEKYLQKKIKTKCLK